MTDNVFDESTSNSTASDTDQYQELLGSIQNSDGTPKYDSVEKAFDSIKSAQEHISRLEAENATLRELETKAQTMEEMLLKMQQTTSDQTVNHTQVTTPTQSALTEDQIAEIAKSQFTKLQTQDVVNSNLTSFNKALQEKFGSKSREEFNSALTKTGLTKDDIQRIAARSPDAAVKILGLDKPTTIVPNAKSSIQHPSNPINIDELPQRTEGMSDKEYFSLISSHYRS